MKKTKKSAKISRQIEKQKWKHTTDVTTFANAPLNQTLTKLNIPGVGLTEEWIQKRQQGETHASEPKERFRFFHFIFTNLREPFTLILIAISIYSFIMFGLKGDLTYIVGGMVVVFLVSFSVTFDLIARWAMHKDNLKIKQTSKETVKVLRNIKIPNNLLAFTQDEKQLLDQLIEIDYRDLLIGDLIYLRSGDLVPVDAKIIYDQDSLSVDQELLLGTKNATPKKRFNSSLNNNIFFLSNIIYRGTRVVHGNLWALVLYKGSETYYEHLKKTSLEKKEKTAFSLQTKKVTKFLITCITVFSPIIFVLALILAGTRKGFDDVNVWINSIIFGMTIVICLAPDSLPLSLTSAFSRTRKHLAEKKIVSRDISAAQNIGIMDVLAIDMQQTFVNKEYVIDDFINLNAAHSPAVVKWATLSYLSSPTQNKELENALKREQKMVKITKTLQAEFEFIRKVNFYGVPRTYASVVEDKNHQRWAIIRGPKALILNNSVAYYNREGKIKKINKTHLNPVIKKTFNQLNHEGLWSIGVAIKKIHDFKSADDQEVLSPDYIYLGLINYVQTIVSGAKESLRELQHQALALKFMSHEPLDQTLVLAKNLDFRVINYLSRAEIVGMTDLQLSRKIKTTNLFYDLDYLTEIRIIKNFKKAGHTIGYLGHGLDNALQILNANIGITSYSSDVFAKQNAKLIINDGNIHDIVEAIIKGRQASVNMMKFIKVRIAWAIAITIKMVVGLAWFNAEPMNAMELLTLNLIFDIGEFLLVFDRVDPHYIQKPVRWDTRSILPFALWNTVVFELVALTNVTVFLYAIEPGILAQIREQDTGGGNGLMWIQTICWLEDVITHLLFILMIRTHYQKWFRAKTSPSLLIAITSLILFVILVPIVPTLNHAFTLDPPIWIWWVFFFLLIGVYCLVMEAWKNTYVRIFNKWL